MPCSLRALLAVGFAAAGKPGLVTSAQAPSLPEPRQDNFSGSGSLAHDLDSLGAASFFEVFGQVCGVSGLLFR